MEQTLSNNVSSSSADEAKKQRKKQAKREAKAMLEVEQAKQNVQRAERKVAKSQARLEARETDLHTLEAKLAKIRTASQESEADTSSGGVDGNQGQTEAAQQAAGAATSGSQPDVITEGDEASPVNSPPSTDQEGSLPAGEGHADILQNQGSASSEEDNFDQGSDSENWSVSAGDPEDDDSDSEEVRTQKRTLRFRRRLGPLGQPLTEEESYTRLEEAMSQDIDAGDTDY